MCVDNLDEDIVNKSVDDVKTAAATAWAAAGSKSARRRVRQRMAKKLSHMVGKEDVRTIVEQFKAASAHLPQTQQDLPAGRQEQTQPGSSSSLAPFQVVYVPGPVRLMVPSVQLQSPMRKATDCAAQERSQSAETPCISCDDYAGCTLEDTSCSYEQILAQPTERQQLPCTAHVVVHCSHDEKRLDAPEHTLTWHSQNATQHTSIPVARTFVHFASSEADCAKRRSRSMCGGLHGQFQ
eukprot:TRINITY_DN57153_c0_g1_i1.p1 TRINITY_DN57153_c0_g1~~TRINITY_DN57153_c0_g1_i1.p1  ORF type:complete len:238 (+),score=42.25 TRINITY_DN57153_c0_g1_i1:81-794(+)